MLFLSVPLVLLALLAIYFIIRMVSSRHKLHKDFTRHTHTTRTFYGPGPSQTDARP